jgi:hypothetical protein
MKTKLPQRGSLALVDFMTKLAPNGDSSLIARDDRTCRGQEEVTESYPGCRSRRRKSSQSRMTRAVLILIVIVGEVTPRYPRILPEIFFGPEEDARESLRPSGRRGQANDGD